MNLKPGLPPNIAKLRDVFAIRPTTLFTYGQDLYVQENSTLQPHIMAHEEVHALQQGDNPESWWERYLVDPAFRLAQELAAYGAQYAWLKAHMPTKQHKAILFDFASDLSSDMYGRMVTHLEAETKIRYEAQKVGTTAVDK